VSTTFPAGRMQLAETAARQYAAMAKLDKTIELDHRLRDLIKLRASQINGCAFCIDMHWKDAVAAGETEERLYSLNAWQESPFYDERELAALALCEAITRIYEGHVPDEVWQRARATFSEEELAQLIFAVTAINAWNRLAITTRMEPGHYRPAARQP
jgi:AhpD family alkylhydroperoxidase